MHTKTMLSFDDRRKLPSLLLIDDDLVSREVTATVLTMNGFLVTTAEDGPSALHLLGSHHAFTRGGALRDQTRTVW